MTCDRNIECVTTSGNAKWCTGPKMKDCYIFDPSSREFDSVIKVCTYDTHMDDNHYVLSDKAKTRGSVRALRLLSVNKVLMGSEVKL